MPVGTIRGRYELDAPALKTLKELELQGVRTQKQMRDLGKEMDQLAGPQAQGKVKAYQSSIKDMGDSSNRVHEEMRLDWVETTRVVGMEVDSQIRHMDRLGARLDSLSQKRVTPEVDIDGIVSANAQLDELEARLDRFNHRRATATAAIRPSGGTPRTGGLGALPQGGGGGFMGSGGSGGGQQRRRPIDFGMSGIRPRSLLMGLGVGFARPLIGGAGALLGSAYEGALGAGALGATGYGVAGIGGGLTYAVAKPMATTMQAANKAAANLNLQIALHGQTSTQAAAAQDKLNQALKAAPQGTRGFLKELTDFRAQWNRETRGAQSNLLSGGRGFMSGVRQGLPGFAQDAGIATGAVGTQATRFGQFLGTDRNVQMGVRTGSQMFAENLPYVRRDTQAIVTMWLNLIRAMRPFFLDFNRNVTKVLDTYAKRSQDQYRLRAALGRDIDQLKNWIKLAGAAYRLTRDLLHLGAPSGGSLVTDLTKQLDAWDRQVNKNPAKVRTFFDQSVGSVKTLAGAIGGLTKSLNDLLKALGPTLDGISGLVGAAGQLGLGGTPGLLGAGYAGYRALRGGGGFGFGIGGGARGAGGGAAGAGGGAGPGGAASGMMMLPIGGGLTNRYGSAFEAPSFQGAGGIVSARYGGPVSQVGRGRVLGSRLLGRAAGIGGPAVATAGRAALRAYLPIAGLLAAGTAIGFQGPISDKIGAGLSQFTGGLLQAPMTRDAHRSRGQQIATDYITAATRGGQGPRNVGEAFRQENQLANQLQYAQGELRLHPGADAYRLQGINAHGVPSGPSRTLDHTEMDAYIRGLKQADAYSKDIYRNLNQTTQVNRADRQIADLGNAFDILNKKLGPRAAFRSWVGDLTTDMRHAGPIQKRELARAGASWVETMRRNGQLTSGEARRANRAIEDSFAQMGKRVKVINGQIFDGTQAEWSKISDAMGSAAEKARERVTTAFTQIQTQAVNSLEAMGYSGADARRVVRAMEKYGVKNVNRGPSAQGRTAGSRSAGPVGSPGTGTGIPMRERGGRVLAPSNRYDLSDRLDLGGAIVGHGEMVVNRHTERRINQMLARNNTTLEREVMYEGRPHSARMLARGGRLGSAVGGLGGGLRSAVSLQGVHPQVLAAGRAIEGAFPGLMISSATGGGHVPGSYHYKGMALDISGAQAEMDRAAVWIRRSGLYRKLLEGIHNPGLAVKNGQLVSPSVYSAVWQNHRNHIHIAAGGSGALGSASGAMPGGAGALSQSVNLHAQASGLGGYPGLLADTAGGAYAAGLQRRLNHYLGAHAGGGGGALSGLGGFTGGGSARANQMLGRRMMLAAGWPAAEWPALRSLWNQESGWLPKTNPGSGAYGIPQALGHGHPYDINDIPGQLRWGLNYIKQRYGSPSAAWAHERSHNWYERGGRLPRFAGFLKRGGSFLADRPTHFVAGEDGQEEINVKPLRPPRTPAGGASSGVSGGVHVHFHGDISVRSDADIDKIAEKVGAVLLRHVKGGPKKDEELLHG